MKIALIGHGSMGKAVSGLALANGHEIVFVVDEQHAVLGAEEVGALFSGCDVAIDFTVADAVRRNVEACLSAGIPLVEGTTGWNARREEILSLVSSKNGSFLYGSNFSVGVNLFFHLADQASALISKFSEYEPFIEERHHSRKKDAPSGTALKMKEVMSAHFPEEIPVSSTRAGNIPGTHVAGFDGSADTIELVHTARSREGFAGGALLGAEWLVGRKGCFQFSDVLDDILKNQL